MKPSDHNSPKPPTRPWKVRSQAAPPNELVNELGLSLRLVELLFNRGLADISAITRFLSPSLHELPDPFQLSGMTAAVERLLSAFQREEKIFVFGDYDMDGISATAILVDYLRRAGFAVDYSIPIRLVEGYGLNAQAIDNAVESGAKLAITVDCGIANASEIEYGANQGLDFIVTDHHQIPAEVPLRAVAVINPHLPESTYPDRDLAGVGVAFNLLMALRRRLREAGLAREINLLRYLDLVAMGTVADVVSLSGVNRILTRFGLNEINQSRRLGIRALLQVCQIPRDQPLTSRDLAFRITPKVNAVGRVANAASAVELFLTDDRARAWQLAKYLSDCNQQRLEIEQRIRKEAEELLAAQPELARGRVILLAAEDWHPGVVGIVATRIMEIHDKPVLLLARENGVARGSGRSRPGLNLVQALEHCQEWLLRFGGHTQAVGLTVAEENLDRLRDCLNRYFTGIEPESRQPPELLLDGFLEAAEISPELWQELERLQPFGQGNPEPVFALAGMELKSIAPLGRSGAGSTPRHFRFTLFCPQHKRRLSGVAFNLEGPPPKAGSLLDLAFTLEENHWQGQRELRLKLVAFRPAETG